MKKLIIFILSGMLLLSIGARAEIVFKDCYSPRWGAYFDKNKYDYDYYKIDEKNKTITRVWSLTNKYWNEEAKFFYNPQKNAVFNFVLTFSDKNIIQGLKKKDDIYEEITLELNTGVVKHQLYSNNLRPDAFYFQCKNK
jgi:hypothetical protein